MISAQIMKVLAAKDVLTAWGDGEQTRSFTYVSDEVAGMMLAVEKYPEADALNIGTSEEIRIKDLIGLIVQLSGKKLRIEYDTTKPSGAPGSLSLHLEVMRDSLAINRKCASNRAWVRQWDGINGTRLSA